MTFLVTNIHLSGVLKDWKEKDRTHVDWVKAWLCTLTELQAYVKKYYTTGLTWNPAVGEAKALVKAGGASPPPPPVPAPRRDARLAEQGRGPLTNQHARKIFQAPEAMPGSVGLLRVRLYAGFGGSQVCGMGQVDTKSAVRSSGEGRMLMVSTGATALSFNPLDLDIMDKMPICIDKTFINTWLLQVRNFIDSSN